MIQCVKGTRDILPDEIPLWHLVERTCAEVFHLYGFEEIRLPVFEVTELFARGIGGATDIVEKEMYTFPDRNGQSITLRPEGTASVARAYIQHNMGSLSHIHKLYYAGPMFRYERPQKGRYRQFYQIGAEVLGSDSPAVEAEVLDMLQVVLDRLGIGPTQVTVNSIGCPACRPRFIEVLQQGEREIASSLCEECRRRIEANPLRVLDCKNPQCQGPIDSLPSIPSYLCDACGGHHARFLDLLRQSGVAFQQNARMVRGLDYYLRTTFEISSGALGAQNALLGGGRYDGLIPLLGGDPTPGFGFALGLDRFVLALPESAKGRVARAPDVYLAPLGDAAFTAAVSIAAGLRRAGVSAWLDFQPRSVKSHMRLANKLAARRAAILGDSEMERGEVSLKDMATGDQRAVFLSALADELKM